jgi:hypothetical protein
MIGAKKRLTNLVGSDDGISILVETDLTVAGLTFLMT